MVRVSIKNQSGVVNWQSEFKTMGEADAWIAGNVATNAWGKAGEFTVEKIDISAEVAAIEAKIAARATRLAGLRTLDAKVGSFTAGELQTIAKALIKEIIGD